MSRHRSSAARVAPSRDRDSLALYFDVLRHAVPMAREEETCVAERAQRGDAAAVEQLVRANLRFVVAVAKRYRHMGLALEDLIAEGNTGLLRAAEHFDPSRGVRFAHYALWWIRNAILRALAAQGTEVARPIHDAMAELRLRHRIDTVRQELGREPTTREIAENLRIDPERVIAQRVGWRHPVTFDGVTDHERGVSDDVGRLASDGRADDAADDELKAAIEQVLDSLPARERQVLRLAYGFDVDPAPTLAGVAAQLGVSPQRAAALRDRALSRLRASPQARRLAHMMR